MNKYWLIREFSKLTGVTVRTLHYYDEQGLLKPHHKNNAGYRFYSSEELIYLQKINILKYIGFSLNQIKTLLLSNKLDWLNSLNLQAKIIRNNVANFEHRLMLIDYSIAFYSTYNGIDWQTIYKRFNVLTDNKKSFETDTRLFKDINRNQSQKFFN
jgi:DNA-binding transcriptional MerR regulator